MEYTGKSTVTLRFHFFRRRAVPAQLADTVRSQSTAMLWLMSNVLESEDFLFAIGIFHWPFLVTQFRWSDIATRMLTPAMTMTRKWIWNPSGEIMAIFLQQNPHSYLSAPNSSSSFSCSSTPPIIIGVPRTVHITQQKRQSKHMQRKILDNSPTWKQNSTSWSSLRSSQRNIIMHRLFCNIRCIYRDVSVFGITTWHVHYRIPKTFTKIRP